MPHTRSAKKHDRKAEKRRLHNRAVIKSIKTQIKKFIETLADQPVEKALGARSFVKTALGPTNTSSPSSTPL